MSKSSKLLQSTLAASYLALESGCALSPATPQAHYELMTTPTPSAPDQTFRTILNHCDKTHKTIFDCFYQEPHQLVQFAKKFYDRTDQFEKGLIPDAYSDYDAKTLHQYEKSHPEISFQLDQAEEHLQSLTIEYENQPRHISFDPPVEIKFYPYLINWAKINLEAIVKNHGRENHFIDPLHNRPIVLKPFYNGDLITNFSVEAGQFINFSPLNSPEKWLSYERESNQIRVEKIIDEANGKIQTSSGLGNPNDRTYIEFNQIPQVRRVYNDGRTNITKFVSPVCKLQTHFEQNGNQQKLTMKEWECQLPNGLIVYANIFPQEEKTPVKKTLKPKKVTFKFPDELREMEVTFGPSQNAVEYERDEQWIFGKPPIVLDPKIDKKKFSYSPLYERPFYSTSYSEFLREIQLPSANSEFGEIILEDGTSIGKFSQWKKAAAAKGEKLDSNDYLNLLVKKLKFPLDFYSFAKLCDRDYLLQFTQPDQKTKWETAWGNISTPTQFIEKNSPGEVWSAVFLMQEILKRQGIRSQVIDTVSLTVNKADQKKIPKEFLFPTLLWLTSRSDGKFDVNFFNIASVGRNGIIYNPEADNNSEKLFLDHSGFSEEEEAVKAWFKLTGKSEAQANQLYNSGKAFLWKILGRQFPAYHINQQGKLDFHMTSIGELKN